MIKEILFQVPHIKLVILENTNYCLLVEDTELNDFIEDFLVENDIYIFEVSIDNKNSLSVYYNYFDGNLELENLIDVLRKLEINEIETIFKLNN